MKQVFYLTRWISWVVIVFATLAMARDAQQGKITISTNSDQAYQYFLQGRNLQERLQAQESIKYFQKAIEEDSTFAMAYIYLAQVSPIVSDFFANLDKAKKHINTVSEGEKIWILGFDAGVNGFVMKQRELYHKLVELFPGDERALNLLGAHYFGQQDYQRALEYYARSIAINPDFSTPYNQMGYAYRFLNDYTGAEKAFQKYIKLIPNDPNPYDSYAELLMKMGRFDQSIEQYHKALTYNPNFVASYLGIATDLNLKGQHVEARKQLKKLFELSRNDGELRAAHFARVISYVDEGKMDMALLELEAQYKIAEKRNDVASMAGDLVAMGNIYLEMAKQDEAAKRFDKARAIVENSNLTREIKDNFNRGYLYNMARTAVNRNDLDGAQTNTDEFCKQVTLIQNPFQMLLCHELKGMIAYASHNYSQALEEFQQANLQNPYNLYRLGRVYDNMLEKEKATEFYNQAKNFNALNNLNYAFLRNIMR
jgi:tetratricopeptide (TPR) repeat protein